MADTKLLPRNPTPEMMAHWRKGRVMPAYVGSQEKADAAAVVRWQKFWDAMPPAPPEDAESVKAREAVETAARIIYDGWKDLPGWVPWVDGGNSHKQTEARHLAAAGAHPSSNGLGSTQPAPAS